MLLTALARYSNTPILKQKKTISKKLFCLTLGAVLLALSVLVEAQQATKKIPRVGIPLSTRRRFKKTASKPFGKRYESLVTLRVKTSTSNTAMRTANPNGCPNWPPSWWL